MQPDAYDKLRDDRADFRLEDEERGEPTTEDVKAARQGSDGGDV